MRRHSHLGFTTPWSRPIRPTPEGPTFAKRLAEEVGEQWSRLSSVVVPWRSRRFARKLEGWRAHWFSCGVRTDALDHERVTHIVNELYRANDMAPPRLWIVPSPRAAIELETSLQDERVLTRQIRFREPSLVSPRLPRFSGSDNREMFERATLVGSLQRTFEDGLADVVSQGLSDERSVFRRLRDSASYIESLSTELRDFRRRRTRVTSPTFGPEQLAQVAWSRSPVGKGLFRRIGRMSWRDYADEFQACVEYLPWWTPLRHNVVVCERPSTLQWSDEEVPVLHCESGPAIEFRDGWRVYALRSVVATEEQVTGSPAPHQVLGERSPELRRMLLQRLRNRTDSLLSLPGTLVLDVDMVSVLPSDAGEAAVAMRALVLLPNRDRCLLTTDGSTDNVYCLPVPSSVGAFDCAGAHRLIAPFSLADTDIVAQS